MGRAFSGRLFGRGWALGLVLLLATGSLGAETLKLMCWNVRNYTLTDRMTEGGWRQAYPKPEAEKTALRAIILAEDPDILAVQEVGGAAYVEELRQDLRTEGLDFPHIAVLPAQDTARMNAVLSKRPFKQVFGHKDMDFKYFERRMRMSRGLLEVVFESGETEWSLFVVHLKSRYTDDDRDPQSTMRRTREAQVARDLIRHRHPPESQPRYLVVGDFNDHKESAALRRFLEVNEQPLTLMLDAEDSRSHRWTHFYGRQDSYERVDFLLASPAMLEHVVPETAAIIDDPLALQASDHRPLTLQLEFTD
ncbi:MAG: endonuclease/exonuclease/phosphatase family protein [Verrucomicrobiota bacterium]